MSNLIETIDTNMTTLLFYIYKAYMCVNLEKPILKYMSNLFPNSVIFWGILGWFIALFVYIQHCTLKKLRTFVFWILVLEQGIAVLTSRVYRLFSAIFFRSRNSYQLIKLPIGCVGAILVPDFEMRHKSTAVLVQRHFQVFGVHSFGRDMFHPIVPPTQNCSKEWRAGAQ